MTLRSSDLQSDSDLDSIRNSCDVSFTNNVERCIWRKYVPFPWFRNSPILGGRNGFMLSLSTSPKLGNSVIPEKALSKCSSDTLDLGHSYTQVKSYGPKTNLVTATLPFVL